MAKPPPPAVDIVPRLRMVATEVDDTAIDEVVALLLEAAEDIETLRLLVGIRKEIELEDAEPEGRC
ncbi:hypothetical protein [Labrys sp. WJW]|uniref:hypothetical protein n=1 Tax=Labrys sp. WJW TaxID=1737983 RepID=UPI0012EAA4AF|nr:hypothetical protein [Labrys sp. WJW]